MDTYIIYYFTLILLLTLSGTDGTGVDTSSEKPTSSGISRLASCTIKASEVSLLTKGEKGEKGAIGPKGDPGAIGAEGIKGEKGFPGPLSLNTCACPLPNPEVADIGLGTEKNPFKTTCKVAASDPDDTKEYYLQPNGLDKFRVRCQAGLTCLLLQGPVKEYNISNRNEPFWLSSVNSEAWNVAGMYGLNLEQLQWLQMNSQSVTQTIKYHCKNSVPISKDNKKSIKLLTWNDVLIGPYPTEITPLYYTVPDGKNDCEDSDIKESEWLSTEIEVTSILSNRLPVLDFYIQDARGAQQFVKIEHVKLCFN